MAAQEIQSLRFWFQQHYNLSPNDPRYTSITDEEIALEYEKVLAYNGKPLSECFKCKIKTHRDKCPTCDTELSGDSKLDEGLARMEAGEKIDLEALARGGDWEPVKKGGEA